MQAQQALVIFSEAERPVGDRLIKIAAETDRIEGYSEAHAIAIARMAERIGALIGVHGVDLTALKFAALAHDLGERAMKRNYLLQPGPLSWEETLDLWRHPILGEQAAGDLRLSRQTQLLIRWHHEWWNGQGYPDGLAGEAIPVGARILRAVDSYFALISNRPHRPRFDRNEAEQIIADMAGIEFDPLIVKLLLATLAEERKNMEVEILVPTAQSESEALFVEPEAAPAGFADQAIEPQPESIALAETAVDDIHTTPEPGAAATDLQTETEIEWPIQQRETDEDQPPVDNELPSVRTENESVTPEAPDEAQPPAQTGVIESSSDSGETRNQR